MKAIGVLVLAVALVLAFSALVYAVVIPIVGRVMRMVDPEAR